MKIVIVPSDNMVLKNDINEYGLDLSSCNIPNNVHALQWKDNSGHIEYNDGSFNEIISELPSWANSAVSVFDNIVNSQNTEPTYQDKCNGVRFYRNLLLQESDWTQLADAQLTEQQKLNWATYRQQLRDITNSDTFPDNVVYPTKPE